MGLAALHERGTISPPMSWRLFESCASPQGVHQSGGVEDVVTIEA